MFNTIKRWFTPKNRLSINRVPKRNTPKNYPKGIVCEHKPRGCTILFRDTDNEYTFHTYKDAAVFLSHRYKSDVRWYDVRNAITLAGKSALSHYPELFVIYK